MKHLWFIVRRIWSQEWWSLFRGTLLAIAVLGAGVALLGLSGWFITAAGIAGLAGIGIAFDVFRPSAAVRFLALGRTGARYGERMLTHDATLRSLASLRVALLESVLALPHEKSAPLRVPEQINQITSDVDALDGVALRLIIPVLAAVITLAGTAIALWYLVHPLVAVVTLACLVPLSVVAFVYLLAVASKPAKEAHLLQRRFRREVMDLIRNRAAIAMAGRLVEFRNSGLETERQARAVRARIDRQERNAGFLVSMAHLAGLSAVLLLAVVLVPEGKTGAAFLALAFLAFLALGEAVLPLRRGFSESGKMADAATRIAPMLGAGSETAPVETGGAVSKHATGNKDAFLEYANVSYAYPGAPHLLIADFSLSLAKGETIALTGTSGAGKSTLLQIGAALIRPVSGGICLQGKALDSYAEGELRQRIGMLPQRSALMSGTIYETLALGKPDLSEDEAWRALQAVALDSVISGRGGLESRLGESGSGLSGGEMRRLALARLVVRKPEVLLLDEPTEGLDGQTARIVLSGIRRILPQSAMLIASHRTAEREIADCVISVG